MEPTRRQFLWASVGVAVAGQLPAAGAGFAERMAANEGQEAAYGSSHFGSWSEDEFGLPAFRYTCNQTTDPRAATPVQPGLLGSTEHIHQVGNDRITALASNFGHVRVRQDEGGPKILNDVDPEMSQFGGGLGYLTDGHETLSSYYDGRGEGFERIFGVGYYTKKVVGQSYSVEQVISAPFGDDPVLLSQVTLTNRRDVAATVRWVEYWGCQPFQLSFRAFIEAMGGRTNATELRRDLGRRFSHQIVPLDGKRGLVESKRFEGRSAEDEKAWERAKDALRANPYGFITPAQELKPGTYFDAVELPRTFLVSLDAPADGFSSDAAAFFGSGGVANPSGLQKALGNSLEAGSGHAGLLLERRLQLGPNETRTLRFLYGYLPGGFEVDALIARYKTATVQQSSEEWKRHGMRFEVPAEPWVKREAAWNYYYLRSSQTYDDFFGEHILNQNGFYQYTMGFQGAARDPLQHCLPFLFSDSEIVRSVLRYTLEEVRDDGSLPYGIVGHGVVAPIISDKASDLPLWLLWTASEYVLATRDVDFLKEEIRARFSATEGRTDTVRNLLARCFRHQVEDVGVGQHGVVRMLNDDWNDGLLFTFAALSFREVAETGESVLNSAMSAWVFDEYARMLRFAGDDSGLGEKAKASAEKDREATRAQWNGKWFRRAWMGEKLGWLGETTLWIEPQPWAMLAGAASAEQGRALVQTMNELLRQGPLGATQMSDGPDLRMGGATKVGTLERGAIWPSLNQTLVWALGGVDPAMAWDEWKRNSLARHAEAYPDIWYGAWSGPDSYNSPLSKNPGGTADEPFFHGTDFPVLNVHAHACFLYSATKLLGIEFTEAGVEMNLQLPEEAWRMESPLLGVARSAGRFEGWYAPSRPGRWTLRIALPDRMAGAVKAVEVNGTRSAAKRLADGRFVVMGSSAEGKPLRWALR
jgi:hypothetical protein